MAYPDGDYGSHDPATARGTNWRDLTAEQRADLRHELARPECAGLDRRAMLDRLTQRERTGEATRIVQPERVSKENIVAAGGIGLIVAMDGARDYVDPAADTPEGATRQQTIRALAGWFRDMPTFPVADPDFIRAVNAFVGVGVFTEEQGAAILNAGKREEPIPDAERRLGPSRQEVIGLGDLLLTEQDLIDAGVS